MPRADDALIQEVRGTTALFRGPAATPRVLSRNRRQPRRFGSLGVMLLLAAIGALFVPFVSRAQSPDENVYSGDFDGNGSTDTLYLLSSPESGGLITLTNVAIEIEGGWIYIDEQAALPSLPGVAAETYNAVIGNFGASSQSDAILLQPKVSGPHYIVSYSNGAFAIRSYANNQLGLEWSADQHRLLSGDFNGDGWTDVFLQATSRQGTNAVVLRNRHCYGFSSEPNPAQPGSCSNPAPLAWSDAGSLYQGLRWSTSSALVSVGDFNGDGRDDFFVQERPGIVLIDYDVPIPVPLYGQYMNGIVLSQSSGASASFVPGQYYNRRDPALNGVDLSPNTSRTRVVCGPSYCDVKLEAIRFDQYTYILRGGPNGAFASVEAYPPAIGWPSASAAGLVAQPTVTHNGQVVLSWNPAAGPVGWYELRRGTQVVQTVSASTNSVALQLSTPGGYSYTVRACSASACSSDSSTAAVFYHLMENLDAPRPIVAPSTAGSMAYSVNVSSVGEALVQIPISTPPGVNGLNPNLALVYSSGAPRAQRDARRIAGLLGYGWSLSGLSEIRRCRVGISGLGHIELNDDDLLCLGDEPLKVVAGTYWSQNAEYRLERSPNIKIVERGIGQARWFEVFFADGSHGEYGNTEDSVAGYLDYQWSISRMVDAFGNEMVFDYFDDELSGSNYVKKISYAGTEIDFFYERRYDTDWLSYGTWIVSVEAQRLVALNRIDVKVDGALVREYRLENVKAGSGAADALRLNRVQVCAYGEGGIGQQCLAPLIAQWQQIPGAPSEFVHVVTSISDGGIERAQFDYSLLPFTGTQPLNYSEAPFGAVIAEPTTQPEPFGRPTLVVQEMRRVNGIGGWHRTSYKYKGSPLYNNVNRGFVGFAERKITEHAVPDHNTAGTNAPKDVTTYVQHRLAFPFIGRVSQQLTVLNGDITSLNARLDHQELLYSDASLFDGAVRYPFVTHAMTREYLGGTVVSATLSTQTLCFRALSGDTCPGSGTMLAVPTQQIVIARVGGDLSQPSFTPTYWGQVPARVIVSERSSQTKVTNLANVGNVVGFPEKITTTLIANGANPVTRTETRTRFGATRAPDVITRLPGTDHALTTDLGYDSVGNVDQITVSGVDVDLQTTTMSSFQDQRYPRFVTNAEVHVTDVDYDLRFGTPRAVTDPNDRTTLIMRDPFGRVTTMSEPDGTLVMQSYAACVSSVCTARNAIVLVTRTTTNNGAQVTPTERIYLDALNREVLNETEAFGTGDGWIRVETRYDGFGHLTQRSLPYFSTGGAATYANFYHDVRNRVVRETRPDGGNTTSVYAGSAGQTAVTRTETVVVPGSSNVSRVKRSIFDARGFVTSTIDAYGQTGAVTTAYDYDAHGNLANVTVGGQQVAAMQFNAAGFRESITEVNTGATTFVTDALGRLRETTDARGFKTKFDAYDSLNRLTARIDGYGSASPVLNTYIWDPAGAKGSLDKRIVPGFQEDHNYDDLGRLSGVTATIAVTGFPANGDYTMSIGYDTLGRVESVTYPGNGGFSRTYTGRGYLDEVRQGSTSLEKVTQHDAFGRPKRMQFGNDLITEYGHDILGRLTSVRTGPSATPKSIQDLEYAWRSNGILQFRRDLHNGGATTWAETFTYDNLDRTTAATTSGASGRTLDFGYDTLGNVTNKTSNVGSDLDATNLSYTVHRLNGATIGAVNYTFTYDTAGNITDYVPGSGDATKFDYDARGQVTRITVGPTASPTARDEFWYDPDGDRFLKRTTWTEGAATKTGWVLYLFGGTFEQSRVVGDTAVSYRSQVQVTETVVHRHTQPVSGSATNLIEYRHRDHLGSVDVVTNGSGAITSTLAFDPFGGRRSANWTSDITTAERNAVLGSASTTGRGFTDHEHLDRTGFVHMNGRVYDPRIGRFVQPDPIVQAPGYSQSYNRYAYTFNSPMSFTDPSGFQSSPDDYPANNWSTCRSFENCLVLDFNSSPAPRMPVELSAEQIAEIFEMAETRYYIEAVEPTLRSTVGGIDLGSTGEGHVRPESVKPVSDWLVDYVGDVRASWYYGFEDFDLEANLAGLPPIVGGPIKAGRSAFEIARAGGKHAGFLKNYLGRSPSEIQKAIVSIEKQIADHRSWIANPELKIPNFRSLDPRQQAALVNSKWPSDIARQLEQLDILRGLLGGQ